MRPPHRLRRAASSVRRLGATLGLGLCLLAGEAGATERKWSIRDVVDAVVRRHPRRQAMAEWEEVARSGVDTARATFNPSLMTDNGTAEFTYRFGISQVVELGPKRRERMDAAGREIGIQHAESSAFVLDLRADAQEAYVAAYYSSEEEAELRRVFASLQRMEDLALRRNDQGSREDQLEARVTGIHIQRAIDEAALAHVSNDIRINVMLGLAPDYDIQLVDPEPHTDAWWLAGAAKDWESSFRRAWPKLVASAFADRPELQKLEAQRAKARAEERLAKAMRVPNLALTAGPDLNSQGRDTWGGFFMVGIDVPVFNRQVGPLHAAQARQRGLGHEHEALRADILGEVADAVARACFHRAQVVRYETALLELGTREFEKALSAFADGSASYLETVRAHATYATTLVAWVRARRAWQTSLAHVERSLGLVTVDGPLPTAPPANGRR